MFNNNVPPQCYILLLFLGDCVLFHMITRDSQKTPLENFFFNRFESQISSTKRKNPLK